MAYTPIPAFGGTVPNRGTQSASAFATNADSYLTYLTANFAPGVNASGVYIDGIGTQVTADKTATTNAKNAAETAKTAAQGAANFKGEWSSLSGALNIPASVSHGGVVYTLKENLANVASETPGVSTKWIRLPKPLEATTSTTGGGFSQFTKFGFYRLLNATAELPPNYTSGDNDFFVMVLSLDGLPADFSDSSWRRIIASDARSGAVWETQVLNGVTQPLRSGQSGVKRYYGTGNFTLSGHERTHIVKRWGSGDATITINTAGLTHPELEVIIDSVHANSGVVTITNSGGQTFVPDGTSSSVHTLTGPGTVAFDRYDLGGALNDLMMRRN